VSDDLYLFKRDEGDPEELYERQRQLEEPHGPLAGRQEPWWKRLFR
jgi:hypothetical protein